MIGWKNPKGMDLRGKPERPDENDDDHFLPLSNKANHIFSLYHKDFFPFQRGEQKTQKQVIDGAKA